MDGEKEERKERIVPHTDTFVERIAVNVIVAHTPEGFFVLDFLKPVVFLVVEGDEIKGYKGEVRTDVRIFLSPITAKRLIRALKDQIDKYESTFGEIKIE